MRISSAWLGYAGLVLVAAAVMVRLLFAGSGTVALGLLILGILLFVVYLFRSERTVQGFLGRRSTREGGNVLGASLLVVGIVVLLNLLAISAHWRTDITADRVFTLAPETQEALRDAPDSPRIYVFHPRGTPEADAIRLILEAARQIRPDIIYEILDPWEEPAKAARFNLKDYSTVVEIGERFESFFGTSEEEFTTALLRASRTRKGHIGFFRGHGEPLINDPENGGLRTAAQALGRRGFTPFFVDLHRNPGIADSLDAVVIAGPKTNLSPAETDSVLAYLDRGGRLLVLLDPSSPVTLDSILTRAGLRFDPRFIEDPAQRQPQVLLPSFSNHPVVQSLIRQRIQVVLAGVGEVVLTKPPKGVLQYNLLQSQMSSRVAGDPGSEARSRALAAAAEWEHGKAEARMVVVGDSGFPRNGRFETLGNGDLFLGAVQWLAEDLTASIRPRPRTSRPVILSRQQGRAFMVLLAGILPAAVLLSGLGVWWRRR